MLDMSLAQFIGHIAASINHLKHAEHQAMEQACLLVENEAKREIGTYQSGAGPFVPWAELADSTKDDRARKGFPDNEPLLRTGTLRDSIEHKVGDKEGCIGSDSPIAEYQELGTVHIPPRSFLGGAAVRKGPQVAQILGLSVVRALVGDAVVNRSFPIP